MLNNKVNWGIAGLGNIANRFAADLTMYSQYGQLQAVASRQVDKAVQFSELYNVPVHYGNYQQLAEDESIDIVYVATIHPYHKPLVELFLTHNKHVLVEKPAFTNYKDWQEMQQLAQEKGVMLLEGMKTVAFPAYKALKTYIQKNNLIIDSVDASFGNKSEYNENIFVFNSTLSGGATLDIGVYGVWLYCDLCHLMGVDVPTPNVNIEVFHPEWEVDECVKFVFDGAIKGTIGASISTDLSRTATLKGDDLEIIIHDKWWNPSHIDICHKGEKHTIKHTGGGGFEHEIEHFSQLVLNNKHSSTILRTETSGQVLSILEQALITKGYAHLTTRL